MENYINRIYIRHYHMLHLLELENIVIVGV